MSYRIEYACITHTGYRRSTNQDNILCRGVCLDENTISPYSDNGSVDSADKPVFGVFDGLGGEEKGEVASYIAAREASKLEPEEDLRAQLMQLCLCANEKICSYASKNNVFSMGTTACLAVFDNEKAVMCNIGDSKIFGLFRGKLRQMSTDDLFAVENGKKAPLSQCLGIPADEIQICPHIFDIELMPGQKFLICSDGLTDMLSNEEIEAVLAAESVDAAANSLLDNALDRGGIDNISIMIMTVGEKEQT